MSQCAILGALFVACAAASLYLCLTAPLGYEDDEGFHFEEPEE